MGGSYHIDIKPDIKPIVHPTHKEPVTLRVPFKKELEKLVKRYYPVSEFTYWVSSMVTVKEPNKLRICIDIEEVVTRLNNAKVFSVLVPKMDFGK